MDIISTMRQADNSLLKAEAEDIATWSKLDHNKDCLETFLNYNIAEIQFKTKDDQDCTIVCSANTALVNVFSAKKAKDKEKVANAKSKGMHTRDMFSVLAWDFVDNKPKTISLKQWSIMNFITITPKNILLLDKLLTDLLKKS